MRAFECATAACALQIPGPRAHRPCRRRSAALLLAAALLLGACSPKYDWREIRAPDAGWSAMLPGRQSVAERDILLGELPVKMAMQGARVDETSFAVGSAVLPDARPETRARALAAMREALVRNIGGSVTDSAEVTVPVVNASGQRVGEAPGVQITASGQIRGKPATLAARLVVRNARAVQALVVGPAVEGDAVDTFFDSLRVHD